MKISLFLIVVLLFSCTKSIVTSKVPEASTDRSSEIINGILKIPTRQMDELHQRLGEYTVALVAITEEHGEKVVTTYCTGVWVGEDEILSAGHCVKDEAAKPWETPVGKGIYYVIKSEISDDEVTYHGGKVISFSEKPDLVLIKVEGKRLIHLSVGLASELPAIGEVVYGVGHPDTLAWTFVTGEVSAYRKNIFGNIIQVNMAIWNGNSGGGLFDREGKLIGICGWKTKIPGMGYYVQIDEIRKFLFEGRLANSK